MIPRFTVYKTATEPAPVVWNTYYETQIIGVALRIGSHKLLSIQWRRPGQITSQSRTNVQHRREQARTDVRPKGDH